MREIFLKDRKSAGRRILAAVAACAGLWMLIACGQEYQGVLVPVQDAGTGKWGYADTTGKNRLAPKWDEASFFSEDLAVVKSGDKFGFVDRKGTEIIPLQYESAESFDDGLARVSSGGKFGFVDRIGTEVIPLKYESAEPFSEGLALVKSDGKYGFIDKSGNEIVPCKYDEIGDYSEGLAIVHADGKYGYIDKSRKEIIPLQYDDAEPFSDEKAFVELDGKRGAVDINGKTVVPFVDITIFRMISVNVPGSVVFTLAKGKEIKGVSVYLVSGEQSVAGTIYASGIISFSNESMSYTDQTTFTAKDFKVPSGFDAKKIRFEAKGETFYYDIAKKRWTSN